MDQNPENAEFLKEFAHDCQDIFVELDDLVAVLRNHLEDDKPVSRRTIDQACRKFLSIQSSAEFLGLGPVYQVCFLISDYFETLPGQDHRLCSAEVDMVATGLRVLVDWISRLEATGDLGDADEESEHVLALLYSLTMGNEEQAKEQPAPSSAVRVTPMQDFEEVPDAFHIQITPEMMAIFIAEAEEHLEQTEACLLGLERNLNDNELIDQAFRGVHTFKGNSGLFNFVQMERLGHEFESILEEYKNGRPVDPNGISLLLEVLDALKSAVHRLPDGQGEVPRLDDFLARLHELQTGLSPGERPAPRPGSLIGEILLEMGAIQRDDLEQALIRQGTAGRSSAEVPLETTSLTDDAISGVTMFDDMPQLAGPTGRKKSATQNIRVDLYKLDALMNLVGELIIAENTVTHNPDLEGYDFQNFKKASLQLNRISRELQDISLSLRMVPIDATFHRMVRVVRDVSHKQSKEVDLLLEGEDTEIDKSVIESLAGPLLHLIRNAIDHGIEKPERREQLGKPKTGIINLRAFHEGGEVVIEVRDDGRGMDPEKILAKAKEKGIVAPDAEFHRTQDILDLIFAPGFSTAEQVTDISGRGVGMDVVKRNIEDIKGRVQLQSVLGKGSTVTIRIPLTLAIIEGMLTRVGNQLFTIPLLSISESLRTEPNQITRTVDGSEVVKIRDRLIPTVRLHKLFQVEADHENLCDGILVVVDHERQQLCLFIDEILGQYQTVIKGLSNFMGNVRGISGTSIMSNGDISLILDIGSLVAFAQEKGQQLSKTKK